jgi:two-component system sensor histidine kinase HydH
MLDRKRATFDWLDILWLLFLLALALLPPIHEIHKQFILLAIGVFQLLEGRLIASLPKRGAAYAVLIKILLATLLLDHTGEIGINSNYYPIYYLPVVTAAVYFGPIASLLWTTLTSLAYCAFLIPALQEYEFTAEGATDLATRILFFYIAAVIVNRFASENRRQVQKYQELSEQLEEANRQLRRAEADARRSERLAALGQLSAGLAHEIRNPLGVIKGSADMLSQRVEASNPLARELAGYIGTEVNRLNSLVTRFLDFARPSHLELCASQLSDLVDRVLESVRNQFPDAQVDVERRYAPSTPDVQVDPQLSEQIFVNLVTNAYQAMEGRGRLTITIAPESQNGLDGVGVVVEDSGPGVPSESPEQIFNPFFTSKKEGVGLGLSIVAKIVDDHRGSIRLESPPGQGARFHVFLPASQD